MIPDRVGYDLTFLHIRPYCENPLWSDKGSVFSELFVSNSHLNAFISHTIQQWEASLVF